MIDQMKIDYEEVIIPGDIAVPFLEDYLVYDHELDKQILRQIDTKNGVVSSFVPPGCLPNREDILYGRFASRSESIRSVALVIADFLEKGERPICILENSVSHPDDPCLARDRTPKLSLNEEVYYYLTKNESSLEEIQDALTEAEMPNFFVSVLADVPHDFPFPRPEGIITPADIEIIVRATKKFIVGAYDGEGYLAWTKKEPVR
jgi:hypothetical protein